jgi:hypothetical protein
MTIAFTGGGTGGHFYPIIAITEAINDIVRERRLVAPKLYFWRRNRLIRKLFLKTASPTSRFRRGKSDGTFH